MNEKKISLAANYLASCLHAGASDFRRNFCQDEQSWCSLCMICIIRTRIMLVMSVRPHALAAEPPGMNFEEILCHEKLSIHASLHVMDLCFAHAHFQSRFGTIRRLGR
jgi:hypothetical protein